MAPKPVVIVGGSLSGLMHGVQLKRLGRDVIILEQDPAADRSSHHAGVAFQQSLREFLRRYDDTGVVASIPAHVYAVAHRFGLDRSWPADRHASNWTLLYRILRANFDGLVSPACPVPPPPRKTDGKAEYRAANVFIALWYHQPRDLVVVYYVDGDTGKEASLETGLVIGADGSRSAVRNHVGATVERQYSGYVAWRATLPEKDVSVATRDYFTDRLCTNMVSGPSMAICYIIPTGDGHTAEGERLFNIVWYYNVPQDSPEMAAIFRDARGTLRHNTVPARFVRPEAWERYRAEGAAQLRAPFAELIAKTHEPFLTKIGDSRCTDGPVFCAGRVLLVGDALTALRPHTGFGAEMAAYQCNLLGEVLRGERSLASWASDVQNMADKASRLSVAVGLFGLGSWYQFLRALTSLFLFWFADRKPDRKTPSAGSGGERKSGRGSKE